jgi:hypothetical protein
MSQAKKLNTGPSEAMSFEVVDEKGKHRYISRFNKSWLIGHYTDKKENQIFLVYKKIQNGAVAK